MEKLETNKLGSQAVLLGSILGGNVIGTIATNKIKFLNQNFGRIALIVIGLILAVKAKSDIIKGGAMGIALSGASSFVNDLTKGVAGFDGISGLFGVDGGEVGVGDVIQGADGMLYMVNGLGQLEPYYYYDENLNGNYEDYAALSGADDSVIAGA